MPPDPPHSLSSGSKQVASAAPGLSFLCVHEPDECFVNQSCGLQCLPGSLVLQLLGRQPTQFTVYQRQEPLRRVGISPLNRTEDLYNFLHGLQHEQAADARDYAWLRV
jgi:hypothetical protein